MQFKERQIIEIQIPRNLDATYVMNLQGFTFLRSKSMNW